MPPAADWAVIRPDGAAELDVRGQLQTHDGALVHVRYTGFISRVMELLPPWAAGEPIPRGNYYMMTAPMFETSAPQYAWLQQIITVGIGELAPDVSVAYRVYAVESQVGESLLPRARAAATA